jgi:tetratricopeptide (TPR) repeat protein
VKLTVKPLDAVQWVLYYPPLGESGADASRDQSCEQADANEKSRCLTFRAEERLRVGRVDEAQSDIEEALTLVPNYSEGDALLSIISVVKNDKPRALAMARKATQVNADSLRAWIALSYAQQASFMLEDALASAERAAAIAPGSATAQTRVAELQLSLGRTRSAEQDSIQTTRRRGTTTPS